MTTLHLPFLSSSHLGAGLSPAMSPPCSRDDRALAPSLSQTPPLSRASPALGSTFSRASPHLSCTLPVPLTLAEQLQTLGHPLNTRCAGLGLCHGCQVELLQGAVRHLQHGNLVKAPATLRACEVTPTTALDIRIPQRSLLAATPQVQDTYEIRIPHALAPLTDLPYGIAVDLGTTTIALQLLDLTTGTVLQKASAFNAQMSLGDDVITRISFCHNNLHNLQKLQSALLEGSLLPLLRTLQVPLADVGAVVFAGNTTLLHLLLAEDPTPLGTHPFTPPFTTYCKLLSSVLGDTWHTLLPNADLHLLPSATAFIGADIVSGLLATGMAYEAQTSLLVDVGTNGEIALHHQGQFVACATAAGPAFEGARLHSGSRAVQGALSRIQLNPSGNNHLEWIGQPGITAPTGICGSAYVDFLAEARRLGLLTPAGRFVPPTPCYAITSDLQITECDIASLLTAKAAIAAGITLLLESQHLTPQDVTTVYLAGGFGTRMNAANALAVGLLPGFALHQLRPVGNTSLAGATLALLDASLLPDLSLLSTRVLALDLPRHPAFGDTFLDHLALP